MKWSRIGITNYFISDYGTVRGVRGEVKPRIIKGRVIVSLGSSSTSLSVHRLVAIAFIKNHLNLPFVRHKDGNMQNNYWENLEWSVKNIHSGVCKECHQAKSPKYFAVKKHGSIVYRKVCSTCRNRKSYLKRKEHEFKKIHDIHRLQMATAA